MKRVSMSGFTIIETMLFLAISGALAIGVVTSASTAINVHRYKDATVSLLSYVQGEYNKVLNVQNDRSDTLVCGPGPVISDGADPTTSPRGTSECMIVGRILGTTDGKTFTSSSVYAASKHLASTTTDSQALVESQLFTSVDHNLGSSYTLEWGTRAVYPLSDTPLAPYNLLIVRSPLSGTVFTYHGNTLSDTPDSLVNAGAASSDALMCIDPDGLFGGARNGVSVLARAANTSSIKLAEGGDC